MKNRYLSLTLAGLIWALGSSSAVRGEFARSEVTRGDLLDRVGTQLEANDAVCRMGFELEPNG